jgi:outer membrane protein assembly factor BamB
MKKANYIILFLILAGTCLANAQTPTRWRGPSENGYYPDTGLLKKWPEGGPEVKWHYDELGVGYAAPSIANDRIYITGMEGTMGYIYSLTMDGKFLWKIPYGKEFTVSYPGSRATPVIVGDYMYMLSGLGELTCMSALSGRLYWKKDITKDFDGRLLEWGYNETLVVDGDRLFCMPGGKQNNLIALNRFDGTLIWSSRGRGDKATYCTPLLVNLGSRKLLVTHSEPYILGFDADNGNLLWSHPHTNTYNIHPNTPLFYDNAVFCFSGYGQGGVLLKLSEDGSQVTKKWFSETMDSRIGGAVVINGRIYGSGDKNREWQCIEWDSGKVLYTSKEIGNGVVIAAEGLLYLYSQRGELALVRPGDSGFEILSETKVSSGSGQHWAHPVIHDGILYLRHGNSLIAYHIKE